MFTQYKCDNEKRRILTWLDETKRLCHGLRDTMQHLDYPPQPDISEAVGEEVSNSLSTLAIEVEKTIYVLAELMVHDQLAVEMFASEPGTFIRSQ